MSKKLKCILLIDDDEDDNFFHQFVIRKMGITEEVKVAESGMEALDLLSKSAMVPDLIFLDLNMPRMTGWEFLEQYNNFNKTQEKPVIIIILTTSVNPAEKQRSKVIPGISGFVSKPITEKMLTDILATHFPGTGRQNNE
jgi:CheY-like chemotaxis protein